MQGVDLNPLGIYPPVEFPVPRGTRMLSPLLSWNHSYILYDFLVTVKAAPHECVIRTGQR